MKRPVVITLLVLALALVLAGIGAAIYFGVRDGGFQPQSILPSSTTVESKTVKVKVEEPVSLTVINNAGSVTVIGADVKEIQIKATLTAYANSESAAETELKDIKYAIEKTGNSIIIKYELPDTINFGNNINTVDFVVTVPVNTSANIDANFGGVQIGGLIGDVKVNNDFGDISAENIEGALFIENNSGTVVVRSVKAGSKDVSVTSDFGNITLEKVNGNDISISSNSGKITLNEVRASSDIVTKTDFGDTEFENGSGDSLTVETNSGQVTLVKLKISGQIKVDNDFGNIELAQAIGKSYDLHTNSGNVEADGAEGAFKASTDFGNINLLNGRLVTLKLKTNSGSVTFIGSLGEGPHTVKSDFGEIELTLPSDSKLTVDMKTDFGSIKTDLPVTITTNDGMKESELSGEINGGGAALEVETNSGNIQINVSE